MKHDSQFDILQERLTATIATGSLNPAAGQQARKLLERLQTPVTVAFVGPACEGRQTAINALAACDALPRPINCPAIEVKYGRTDRCFASYACGRKEALSPRETDRLTPDVLFLSIERRLPQLKRLRFLDVVADGPTREISAALNWAARRADVFIWWSERFSKSELAAWLEAPAKMKDHAFLMLTDSGSDDLAARLRTGLSTPFLDVFASDPQAARAASTDWLQSLADGVSRHLRLGREADEAAVELFLHRYEGQAQPDLTQAADPTQATPTPARPWHTDAAKDAEPDQAERDILAYLTPIADARPQPAVSLECLARLRERAHDLASRAGTAPGTEPGTEHSPADTIAHCVDTVQMLVDLVETRSEGEADGLRAHSDLLIEAEETLLLLSAEDDAAAAEDAVCMLLQVRRELEIGLRREVEQPTPQTMAARDTLTARAVG